MNSKLVFGFWEKWFLEIGLDPQTANNLACIFNQQKMDTNSFFALVEETNSVAQFCHTMFEFFNMPVKFSQFLLF